MARTFYRLVLSLFMASLAVPGTVAEPRAREVHLAEGEWEPFVGEALPSYGPVSQVVTTVLGRLGYRPVFSFYPWKRALGMLDAGLAWASFPWFVTSEREAQYLVVREPVWYSRSYLYYQRDNPRLAALPPDLGLEDLRPYTLGGVRGYFYEALYREGGYSYVLSTDVYQAFSMLAAGRVDFVMEDESVARNAIARVAPGREASFCRLLRPYNEMPMYVLVSPSYPGAAAIAAAFESELRLYKKTAEYEALLEASGASSGSCP